ncbi:MAG: Asp-tRNA(Asn)/Glu-tRNA(Gln) amidotransferase subunit GatA [Deltaproteobacteria bacterium]|nr:Asp-tRNA(Asn)/Glu-tRNA(Gln) amidotransferase subunit GatA [Deltaproteobacteria bacterium]
MSELTRLSVDEMRTGLLTGAFTALDLTDAHLKRIDATNEQFNSFLTICADKAREQARVADERIRKEGSQSPALCGIPIAIKDMLLTDGVETTAASKILKGFIPPYDATPVAKLKERDSIILGKTNQDEFAMGSSNENSAFGPVRNPWDPSRVPGGSSGGSVVAVALGQAPLSLGTDTGGSIRQPASLTGVFGMKPTYGRVSRYGVIAFASSLDQVGPFARSTVDLAYALDAICGYDSNDSTSMKREVPAFREELRKWEGKSLEGIRVGVPKEYFIDGNEPDVQAATQESLKTLEKLGAKLVDISLPHTEHALEVYYIIAPAEASSNLSRYDGVRYGYRSPNAKTLSELYSKTRAEGFGREVKRRIMIGTYVLSAGYYDAYYRKAQEVRTLIIDDFKAAFNNHCDVIAAPVSPTTAFKIGEKAQSPLAMYLADVFTIPASLAGLPGMSVPTTLDRNGLPIGLQLLGAPFTESTLLRVSQALEHAGNFDTRRNCS